MVHYRPNLEEFKRLAHRGNLVPVYRQIVADQMTPVVAYRRLVRPDVRQAPSFLLESVVGGERQARYSFMGAQPIGQILAYGTKVRRTLGKQTVEYTCADPMSEMHKLTAAWNLAPLDGSGLPDFTGGWVGFAGYDTIRYSEGEKLTNPPRDDRHLPDMQFGLYREVVAFDHVRKTILAINHVLIDEHDNVEVAYHAGCAQLDALVKRLEHEPLSMRSGDVDLASPIRTLTHSNMTAAQYEAMVAASKKYIGSGDIFQVVLSQRFERTSAADPFDVYRALRIVNPSPYMFYLQADGCILVGSSPEILCKVDHGTVTNRPLAGTRRRGSTPEQDAALEAELLADPKERSEHIMLVDLGRNDVGRVAQPGSIALPAVMHVERYSHVMHISSTVTGKLRPGLTCWDALRAALPVGTVSGAPKVRAMQIIDELEPTRRGPYAGAVGYADFAGNMDMAIALRTMVVTPVEQSPTASFGGAPVWKYHLQAGAGIVADSVPATEYQETVSKASALAKAIDVAESAFR